MADPFRVGGGQVDLVHHRQHFQAVVHRQIGVAQGLGLDALGSVHHQDGPFAGGQRTGNLIVKVHMAGGVDEVELIGFPIVGGIGDFYRPGLNGNAPLPFDVHVVQQLLLHVPEGHGAGLLQDPVGQGGFPVVNVGDDAEITDVVLLICQ